jgi:hypothetical protein
MKVLLTIGEDRASYQQMVGVAKRDIYLLLGELPFWQNFLKGTIGLWFLVMLTLAAAVTCSTYLSGVISLLCTCFMVGASLLGDFIRALAENKAEGGGVFQASFRLVNRMPITAPVDQNPVASLGQGLETLFRFALRLFLKIVPDVQRFFLGDYVANGFDIPWNPVLIFDNFLPAVGYLLPLALLAYYLMNSREIANPS